MRNRSLALAALAGFVTATRPDPITLTGEEVKQAIAQKVLTYGGRNDTEVTVAFGADGRATLRTMTQTSAIRKRAGDEPIYRTSVGTWSVETSGKYCLMFPAGESAASSCYYLQRTGTGTGLAVTDANGGRSIKVDKLE